MSKPLALAALLLGACGGSDGSTNPLHPVNEPEVANLPDDFSFQVTGVDNGSGTFTYVWQNGGTAATVDRSSDVTAGAVLLTVRDASGAVVLVDPVPWSGSVATATGAAGAWTIQVAFDHASGAVNFRAQRL